MGRTRAIVSAMLVCCLASVVGAATLQIDFSDNAGTYSGNLSPGHADGLVTGTTWNTVVGDVGSGLVWDDNSPATGVQVDVGHGNPTVNWGNGLNEAGPAASGTAIYNTGLMLDWHYTSGDSNLGARVSGLAPGDYRVYALIREPDQLGRTYDAAIGVNISTMGDPGVVEVTNIADAGGVTTWADGQNYAATDVTVASTSDWVTVIVDPTNAAYGTLEGLQIVSDPPPPPTVSFPQGGHGYFGIREVKDNGTIATIAQAEASLLSGTGTIVDGQAPFLNFSDPTGSNGGHVGGDSAYLSNPSGGAQDDFVQLANGAVRIPATGTYTFYARGDDGFRLQIKNGTFLSVSDTGDGTATINGDTLLNGSLGGNVNGFGVIDLWAADYELEYLFFERGGGAYNELWAAPGAHTAFNPDVFRLVGDVANGGLQLVQVPEPATLALLSVAACGVGGYVRRRRKA